MLQRARIRRAADRPQHRRIDPPAPTVAPPPGAGGAPSAGADFSIATLSVLPEVTPVARKIQRQENDDRHSAPTPTPAPPANPPGDEAEQLKAGGEGSTTLLAPSVSFKVYSGKTLQDVSNALPQEAGSFTFDIGTATDGDPITKATVTVKQAIELPRWAERDVQCKPIQAAWDRFASALRQHEDEHVKINKQQLGSAHTHYVGKAQSDTQSVTTELENDANAAGQAFDAQTSNGRTGNPPTTIDVDTKCTDKTTAGEPGPEPEPAPTPEQLQAKLEVSEPGDPDEEEADRVAEQVMRIAEPRDRAPLHLAAGASVMRKSSDDRRSVAASSNVVDVTRAGGQPLDADTRAFMEPRFGHDFSRVRIHADDEAAIAARSVNARAYTLGSDVVFASGQYAPASTEGRRLLAHELTHVVQQSRDAGVVSRRIQRAIDTTKGEPIRQELDDPIWSRNSKIEALWASLGTDLPDAINSGAPVTVNPAEKGPQKGKKESYRDLWWRSVIDEEISLSNAGKPVIDAFAKDVINVATTRLRSQRERLGTLLNELKRATEQKTSTVPPQASGGVEDPKKQVSRSNERKPIVSARGLVDSATVADFLENWENMLKRSPVGTRRVDTSGLLKPPDAAPSAPSFDPFPNKPGAAPAPGAAVTPTSDALDVGDAGAKPIFFDPGKSVDEVLAAPDTAGIDRIAWDTLAKTHLNCTMQKGLFQELLEAMLSQDANLAVLHERGLLSQVSAFSGHTDDQAASALMRTTDENYKAADRFLGMLEGGRVDWLGLGPVQGHLLAGGEGASRNWSGITWRGFIDAYFKEKAQAERDEARNAILLQGALALGTFVAFLTPLGPLAAALMVGMDALAVTNAIDASAAADKKADVMQAGADAQVVNKDDARKAKEDAESKRTAMVIDIMLTALPYLPGAAKAGVKAASALNREAHWAKLAEYAMRPHGGFMLGADIVVDLGTAGVSAIAKKAAGGTLSLWTMLGRIQKIRNSLGWSRVSEALARGGDEALLHPGSVYGLEGYVRYHMHGPGLGRERYPIFLAPASANHFVNNQVEGFMRRERDAGHVVDFSVTYGTHGAQEMKPFVESLLRSGNPEILNRLALDKGLMEKFLSSATYEIRVTRGGSASLYRANVTIGPPGPGMSVTTLPPVLIP